MASSSYDEFEDAFPPDILEESPHGLLNETCSICFHAIGNPECDACRDSDIRDRFPKLTIRRRIKLASYILWTGRSN